MITLNNYHIASVKIEKEYNTELLVVFGTLLNKLNSIDNLTERDINNVVNMWKIENIHEIQEINKIFVEKSANIADKQIPPVNDYQNERKIDSLTIANDQMLNVTTEFVRQKFIELAVLEHNYNYNSELSTEFVQNIAKSTEDKIELFSTMSVIQNVREFLFLNAKANNYTEYLWRTQRDNRVRLAHAYMEGKWVLINYPPAETNYYHVGQDYNCRCWAAKFR
jgi:MoaA/NifB/PqqE/SkfB family radical SAM enzyme